MNEVMNEKMQTTKSSSRISFEPTASSKNHKQQKSELNKKNNKVVFKASNPVSLDLEQQNLPDRYTPNTELADFAPDIFDEFSLRPDLSIMCKLCKLYIELSELKDHSDYHGALSYFGLTSLPSTEDQLIEKRKSLLKTAMSRHIKKARDLNTNKAIEWNTKVKQINDAYELLKSYMTNTFELNRQLRKKNVKLDAQGESRVTVNEGIIAIGTCQNQNKSHRITMEDTNIILDSFGENGNLTYIGTFDGYDSDVSSVKCSLQLHLCLLNLLSKFEELNIKYIKEKYVFDEINYLEKYQKSSLVSSDASLQDRDPSKISFAKTESASMRNSSYEFFDPKELEDDGKNYSEEELKILKVYKSAFKYTYKQMDKLLSRGKDEKSFKRWSGATACTCIIENRPKDNSSWIHLANCGDVEVMVVFDNGPKRSRRSYKMLSRLHTVDECVKDRTFIEKNGCRLVETSPGKKKIEGLYSVTRALGFHGDKSVKSFMSPSPSVRSFKIEPNYVCLIIATKGLWSALSYEKVADIVLQLLPLNKILTDDRPSSPGVKALVHHYYYGKEKEKMRDRSNLLDTINDVHENHNQDDPHNDYTRQESFEVNSQSSIRTKRTESSNYEHVNRTKSSEEDYLEQEKKSDDSDYEYYRKSSRPKSVPHHIINKTEKNNTDETNKPSTMEKNYIEVNNNLNPFKSNSDIYPTAKKNVLTNENHDLAVDFGELKTINKSNIKPIGVIESKNESINTSNKYKTSDLNLVHGGVKVVQVNEYELNKTSRKFMNDRVLAKRLDIAEMLSEQLVTSALLAGSTDNITVNCVLLPGCKL